MLVKDQTVSIPQNVYIDTIKAAVEAVYADFGLEPTCTSGNDAKHLKRSMHYQDRALDIRFWDVLAVVAMRIKEKLPPWYEVLVEKDHLHIEADAKHEPPAVV